jgi:hypothetical protein
MVDSEKHFWDLLLVVTILAGFLLCGAMLYAYYWDEWGSPPWDSASYPPSEPY